MSAHCCAPRPAERIPPGYRRALVVALVVNLLIFGVEVVASLQAGSVSLLADSIDFFGDAGNYALSLAVLSLGAAWRARAALVKAASMLAFGFFVTGRAAWAALEGVPPEALTMGLVGGLALAANVGVAVMLYAFRDGDANMRSVWLCTRNDALGNVAVLVAALGVAGTGAAWPDLAVAAVMGTLAISAGWSVLRQARRELSEATLAAANRHA